MIEAGKSANSGKAGDAMRAVNELGSLLDNYEREMQARGPQLYQGHDNADDARLSSAHVAVMMALKNANDLGVLSGPDAELLERELAAPIGFGAVRRGKDAILAQIGQVRQTLAAKRAAVTGAVGSPGAAGAGSSAPIAPSSRPAATVSPVELRSAYDAASAHLRAQGKTDRQITDIIGERP